LIRVLFTFARITYIDKSGSAYRGRELRVPVSVGKMSMEIEYKWSPICANWFFFDSFIIFRRS